VSRRLLLACGRLDVADQEVEDTDYDTVELRENKSVRRRVHDILREHGCLRIPRTAAALEAKIMRRGIPRVHERREQQARREAYVDRCAARTGSPMLSNLVEAIWGP